MRALRGFQPGAHSRRFRRLLATMTALVAVSAIAACSTEPRAVELPGPPPPADAVVAINRQTVLNEFAGTAALGVGVDGLESGGIDRVWTPENISLMRSAGYGPVSFRLRTELGSKAWHWNPQGTWSNPAAQEGYWVSDSTSAADPGVSHGYNLPRRGNTIDQANNDGYSRLTDGDPDTYWKSNPYLDPHFTGETDTQNPQWMMFSFVHQKGYAPLDTMAIDWGEPYARSVKVQYWTGGSDPIYPSADGGKWTDFPSSSFTGTGGRQTFRLAPKPVDATFVRVQLLDGSGTGPAGSTDIRDRLGFAVREVSLGTSQGGSFEDWVEHHHSHHQTHAYASSTDPWHRAADLDGDYEHASLDRILASGLASQPELMAAVPVLYGVPEDAAALLRYVRSRGFPVQRIEMGEEPDGQLAQPEHYAALYLQVAAALKAVDPAIQLGGPGYQTTPDWLSPPDASGNKSWTGRFVSYLEQRDRMADFNFFSFEWYPFDDVCGDAGVQMRSNPAMLADVLKRQEDAGLPKDIPKVITEIGFSSFAGQAEVEMPGAIVNVESVTKFLELGGDTTFAYGIEPAWVFQEREGERCNSWGNLMHFQFYNDHDTRPIATYEGARLLTGEWVEPGAGQHAMLAVNTTSPTAQGGPTVTAYAVRRPDKNVSVMLFNKDLQQTTSVRLEDVQRPLLQLGEEMEMVQYSGQQYQWDPTPGSDSRGRPAKNLPPVRTTIDTTNGAVADLPPNSITVIRFLEP